MFENFFGAGLEFWIGKVVSIDAQKNWHRVIVGVGDIKFVYSAHILIVIILRIKIVILQ